MSYLNRYDIIIHLLPIEYSVVGMGAISLLERFESELVKSSNIGDTRFLQNVEFIRHPGLMNYMVTELDFGRRPSVVIPNREL